MDTVEKIKLHIQKFPEPLQMEVLDFVEFLAARLSAEDSRQIDLQWSQFSLAQAMRGLEDEATPTYSKSDLKETWR